MLFLKHLHLLKPLNLSNLSPPTIYGWKLQECADSQWRSIPTFEGVNIRPCKTYFWCYKPRFKRSKKGVERHWFEWEWKCQKYDRLLMCNRPNWVKAIFRGFEFCKVEKWYVCGNVISLGKLHPRHSIKIYMDELTVLVYIIGMLVIFEIILGNICRWSC